MKICLVEPFHTGSHATWADEFQRRSRHSIELLKLPGRHWKWRMHGGALTLARRFLELERQPDLLLVTDMLDLCSFLALTRTRTANLTTAIYFHENQLTYPWSPQDSDPAEQRDAHYAFINLSSALAANRVLFNSCYHRQTFLEELPRFLKSFPDFQERDCARTIAAKSEVLPLGLDLQRLDRYRPTQKENKEPPLILWNHRWEYDKNPAEFFSALNQLQKEGFDFRVALLGESFGEQADLFQQAREQLGERVLQFGYADDFASYAGWLWRADILPVTSQHDFFGASVVQAIYGNCYPLLPQRLAYPEHLPEDLQADYLYTDHTDLLSRLRNLLRNRSKPKPDPALAEHVARYDWSLQSPVYDDLLEQMMMASQKVRPTLL